MPAVWVFQKVVPGLSWWSQGLGHRLSTKAVSTQYPNPWESAWFVFTIFISWEIWHFLPHFWKWHFAVLGVSSGAWGVLCPAFIPWLSRSALPRVLQAPSWAAVHVCVTPALKHTPAHSLEGCMVFSNLLEQSEREKAKFRDMNMLVTAGIWRKLTVQLL